MENVIIIGGGAAGLLALNILSDKNIPVLLLEKNEKLGKKLYITGKGRCNLTNLSEVDVLLENTKSNPHFLYSAFYSFDSFSLVEYFNNLGLKTKTERGNRVYPVSDKSSDVIKALTKNLNPNIKIKLNTNVTDIVCENNQIIGVNTNNGFESGSIILIATGGLSYPATGSTGDGYKFAKNLGHTVTKLNPSLVPLVTKESWVTNLQGLSLKNVNLTAIADGKKVLSEQGEMIFTHFGISGPLVLKASRYLTSEKGIKKISIDLKPAITNKELDQRILKDFEKFINKDFSNALDDLLPQKIIPVIIELSKIKPTKKVNEITKEERKNLVNLLKNLEMTVETTRGFKEAVITMGGVCVSEIDPSTMESKIIKNLYFAGEVMDLDAFTGGFNLQIAFSTAYLAAINISEKIQGE